MRIGLLLCGHLPDRYNSIAGDYPEMVATLLDDEGVSLVVDAMSYPYLDGSEVDYIEDLNGAQFVVTNPNATATCGCGNSFSI